MADSADSLDPRTAITETDVDHSLNSRIFWTMGIATALAASVSAFFAPWRFTSGLLLGGLLALINHHWLRRSTAAAIGVVAAGQRPRITLLTYVLRYLVIAVAAYIAYELKLASLTAVMAGLSSFVVALFVEALREFYFAITQREEIS
jgi:hypothetical protein